MNHLRLIRNDDTVKYPLYHRATPTHHLQGYNSLFLRRANRPDIRRRAGRSREATRTGQRFTEASVRCACSPPDAQLRPRPEVLGRPGRATEAQSSEARGLVAPATWSHPSARRRFDQTFQQNLTLPTVV